MADSIQEIADSELIERVATNKKELFNLRFQRATGQLENIARVKQVRREIARIKTEIRAREIKAAERVAAGKEA